MCADKTEVKRYDTIGKALSISEDAAKRAVWALDGIDFGDVVIKRKIAWLKKTGTEDFKVIGQRIEVGYDFTRGD